MDVVDYGTLIIRALNALVWTWIFVQLATSDDAAHPAVRRSVMAVVFVGMWVLVIGATVPVGAISLDSARLIYTAFASFALLVGLALITGPWRA